MCVKTNLLEKWQGRATFPFESTIRRKFREVFNRTSTLAQLTRKIFSAEKNNLISHQKSLEKFLNCVKSKV